MNISAEVGKNGDHLLDPVPIGERKGWLELSWGTASVGTAIMAFFIGAMTTFVGGTGIALVSALVVAAIGALIGWGVGHVAYATGLSSSAMARQHGFGRRGSVIVSIAMGAILIGSIAAENMLIFNGLLYWFHLQDTLPIRIVIFGILSIVWILLSSHGFNLVLKSSSVIIIGFAIVLAYIAITSIFGFHSGAGEALVFGTQYSDSVLSRMGVDGTLGKWVFCINVMVGFAGGFALVDADIGRFARTSKDVAIAAVALVAPFNILGLLGGVILHAHAGTLGTMLGGESGTLVITDPQIVADAFIAVAGAVGGIFLLLAQSKVQVVNTYTSALHLGNLSDISIGRVPSTAVLVIAANVIGCVLIATNILEIFAEFMSLLGVLTISISCLFIIDYIWFSRKENTVVERVNWAGVISVLLGFGIAHYALDRIMPIQFVTSLVVVLILYPLLRTLEVRRKLA